jgi:alpha-L-fucosidase
LAGRADGEAAAGPPSSSAVFSDYVTVEYAIDGPPDRKWEANRGMGTSFGYNREETDKDYISATELIGLLADIVSRGGNLLINVGPTATGEIPWAQAERLLILGHWLRTNGAAIYKTKPWERSTGISGEGLPVRYTASDDAVHAIVLGTPSTAALEIDVRLDDGAEVTLEGRPGALSWAATGAGTRIELPERPDEQPAICIRLAPNSAVRDFQEE